jgi:hypothetical protein
VDLPNLTSIPVPLVELVGARMTSVTTTQPPPNSIVYRDTLVRRALAIRDAAATGRLGDNYPFLPSDLLIIDAPASRCADPAVQHAWQSAVRQLSDFTSAYLGQHDLEAVWARILASPCNQIKGVHTTWAQLLAALARRDTAQISSTGETLLDLPASTVTDDERAFLLVAVAAADIGAGDFERASALLAPTGLKVPPVYALALRDLLALSRAGGAANSAVLANTAAH